jgi:hypothetical protein
MIPYHFKKMEGIVLRDGTKTMAKTLRNFATEIHRLDKWSHNTLHNHKLRGLPLNFKPAQIFEKAIEILIENEGCCPECGRRFEYNTDHWISLEYNSPDCFEVICMDCNSQRAIMEQRRGFTYLNSK